jgi:formylglycine-generating enzyme required for sulfatase activity
MAIVCFSPAICQTPAELDIRMYAGLTITGAVGTIYSVEYASELTETNGTGSWSCLEFLQLPSNPYRWVDLSVPTTSRRFYRLVEFSAPTNMVFVPPGTFDFGSPDTEADRRYSEGPQTAVTISSGFWMGKYEVTQADYVAIIGSNPSTFLGDDLRPVETLSWPDAAAYCAALTEQEKTAGRIPEGCAFRLPTEAEWEYACRAGTSTRFSYGDDPTYTGLTDYAWYGANADETTHPVGQKLPNRWGLYDMHGNVDEYCQDWYSSSLPGGIALDPKGPATGTSHPVRGGAWNKGIPGLMRSATRAQIPHPSRGNFIGFRIVLASVSL